MSLFVYFVWGRLKGANGTLKLSKRQFLPKEFLYFNLFNIKIIPSTIAFYNLITSFIII